MEEIRLIINNNVSFMQIKKVKQTRVLQKQLEWTLLLKAFGSLRYKLIGLSQRNYLHLYRGEVDHEPVKNIMHNCIDCSV